MKPMFEDGMSAYWQWLRQEEAGLVLNLTIVTPKFTVTTFAVYTDDLQFIPPK